MPSGPRHAPTTPTVGPAPGLRRALALGALLLLTAACSAPTPSHFTRLWPQKLEQGRSGRPVLGLSTEDGVLILARPAYRPDDLFEMQFPVGNSLVVDYGKLDRVNDNLAVVRPLTARFAEGRFAGSLPEPDETLYIAVRDELDAPVMRPASLWRNGALGDWLDLDEDQDELDALAWEYAGTGVYVLREDRWEICGVLSGLVARLEDQASDDLGLGFLGLAELARILPDQLPYYLHLDRPLRPDFEFGVPLQPGDLEVWPEQPGASDDPVEPDESAEPVGSDEPADDTEGEGEAPADDEPADDTPGEGDAPADDPAPAPEDDEPAADDTEPSDDGR